MTLDDDARKFLKSISGMFDEDENCDCGACRINRREINYERFHEEVRDAMAQVISGGNINESLAFVAALVAMPDFIHLLMIYVYGDGFNAGLEAGRDETGD
jgi:hypothetical protein